MVAHQSLYRRYRSQKFSEILGQPHVTTSLRTAVAEDRQGHAYLFSGPRGTGKTSTARVLAKALNCENLTDGEPCGTCSSCRSIESGNSFDIFELDAASNNKVDDIRELIAKVQLGTPGRTKVYILDEVHMLSTGAENALLKTLEEPPAHVVFVLATTEPQKVVATIRSRTQHFEFHLLPADVLAEHLRWVINDAGLTVSQEGIDYALRQGGGSARDTLSALELVVAAGGVPEGGEVAEGLVRAIGAHDPAEAIAAIQRGLELGREPRTLGEDALDLLRNAFLSAMGAPLAHLNDSHRTTAAEVAAAVGPSGLTRALEAIGQALVEMRQAPDPRVPLEVTVLRLARTPGGADSAPTGGAAASGVDVGALLARIDALEARIAELEAGGTGGASSIAPGQGPSGAPAPATAPTPSRPRLVRPGEGAATPPAARPAAPATDAPGGPRAPRSPRSGTPGADRPAPRPAPAPGAANGATGPDQAGTANAPGQPGAAPGGTDQPAGPDPSHGESTPGPAAAMPRPAAAGSPTQASVTTAWGPVLDSLSQKVRARFKGGSVLAVANGTITYGVPNAIARDRCLQVRDELASALTQHFGQPVALDVVIDTASAAPVDPAKYEPRPAAPAAGDDDDEDIGPVSELVDAPDQSTSGIDRITKAFPGSEIVDA